MQDSVWYDGDGRPLNERLPGGLRCLTDEGIESCVDSIVVKDLNNTIKLIDIPTNQTYWWNVKCEATIGGGIKINDWGDRNWSFTLGQVPSDVVSCM
ncbi:MAG: hypothetical protein PHG85_05635 [Candidatus Altiarchaeota archaeon]|nr:hypothetical protein [Candidatus Altiarchaeota archaeon]